MFKEQFPKHRKLKLQPYGDGPFQILERINDNAYKIDLPYEYGVNATFNIVDLTLFDSGFDSRLNLFEEKRDDTNQSINTIKYPLYVPIEPIIRSRIKALKKAIYELVTKVLARVGDPLEHQEEVMIHLIQVQEGPKTNPSTTLK